MYRGNIDLCFSDAASLIGEQENMEEVQQVEWAVHAKSCFGEVDTWTSAEIKAMGSVIGGL